METPTSAVSGSSVPPPPPMAGKALGAPPLLGKAGGPPPIAGRPGAGIPGGPGSPAQLSGLLPGEEPVNPEEEQFHHASGFWNQPWVQNILPFATSLMFHIMIFAVGYGLYKAVQVIQNPNKEQVIIPDTKQVGKAAMPGGTPHPGPPADSTRDLMQMETKDVKTDDGLDTQKSDKLSQDTSGKGDTDASFGRGPNAHAGHGHGTGLGSGAGGSPAPYGTPGGGDGHMLPKSGIYGTGGSGDKVVYLVDTSGSMIGVFGDVKANLKKSIMALPNSFKTGMIQFDIITFSDEKEPRIFSKTIGGKAQLVFDSEDNKKKAIEFIDDQVASGGTLPMPGIHAAFAYADKPQLVYVMTDGFDNVASFDEVVDAFKKGTADGVTHVNCIQFVAEPDPKLQAVLEQIAKDGHGQFKQIQKSEMQ